jgi:hypothetical protein
MGSLPGVCCCPCTWQAHLRYRDTQSLISRRTPSIVSSRPGAPRSSRAAARTSAMTWACRQAGAGGVGGAPVSREPRRRCCDGAGMQQKPAPLHCSCSSRWSCSQSSHRGLLVLLSRLLDAQAKDGLRGLRSRGEGGQRRKRRQARLAPGHPLAVLLLLGRDHHSAAVGAGSGAAAEPAVSTHTWKLMTVDPRHSHCAPAMAEPAAGASGNDTRRSGACNSHSLLQGGSARCRHGAYRCRRVSEGIDEPIQQFTGDVGGDGW